MTPSMYSQINSILIDDTPEADKIGKLCSLMKVTNLAEAKWPDATTDMDARVRRSLDLLLTEIVIRDVKAILTHSKRDSDKDEPKLTPLEISLDYVYFAVSSYIHDLRLLTPLVILWTAGRMSRKGMEPGICFTQVLHRIYHGDRKDNPPYDLMYAFRDTDVLRSFNAIKEAELLDPVVKRDFLLAMKQILTYLKDNDRDFRKKLTLTEVEKML